MNQNSWRSPSSTPSLELLRRRLHLPPINHGGGGRERVNASLTLQSRCTEGSRGASEKWCEIWETVERSDCFAWCQLWTKRLLPWHKVEECEVFYYFQPNPPCGNRCLLAVLGAGGAGIYRGYCINTDPTHWLANWDAFIIYFRVRGRERAGIMIRLPWPWARKLNVAFLRLW